MGWLLSKPKHPLTPQEQLDSLQRSKKFLGVQVANCGCRSGSRLVGIFYSFKKAPRLPAPGCEAEHCTCQYRGITDRRNGLERRVSRWSPHKADKRTVERRKGSDIWKCYDL